jgi:hypothetical protein
MTDTKATKQLPEWTVGWTWSQFCIGWMRFYYDGNHDVFYLGFLQLEVWH